MEEKEYIIDAFTKEGDNTNLEVNNLNVSCITSKNNKFLLDSEGNLTVKSIKADVLTSDTTLNMIYPIGSIYMSVNETNPGSLFGGVREQIKDKFLLSCGDTYQNGTTGGSDTHYHDFKVGLVCCWGMSGGDNLNNSGAYSYQNNCYSKQSGIESTPTTVNMNGCLVDRLKDITDKVRYSTGDTKPSSHMPPYLTVYMWKRIH